MLADAKAGRFSHLGLYRADRFGRDTVEGLQAATTLMGYGIRIRIANMPSLQPETPDGFFMFVLQMGLAQRKVDVLGQRARDGMEAKMRKGGWAQKAPEGYINKEEAIKNGKYHRWVEPDPIIVRGLREAWDLLLTDRYTIKEICRELAKRGYTRSGERPWAWKNPKTGRWRHADNRLHEIFHNPFYAGWVVSKRFGISYAEVRARWEPVVITEEFERGIEILRNNDDYKSRTRKHTYLLNKLLWVKVGGKHYRMFSSTPTGRNRSYSYYLTHAKPNGKKHRFRCEEIDEQIEDWLEGIVVEPELLPAIRETYREHVRDATQKDRKTKLSELNRRVAELREQETNLARLLITEKISEKTYDQLRAEWRQKMRHAEMNLADLQRDTARYLDDLDVALALMTRLSVLYERLEKKQRSTLLQILAKRIIVDANGEITDHEFHSPFAYLTSLTSGSPQNPQKSGSVQIRSGP